MQCNYKNLQKIIILRINKRQSCTYACQLYDEEQSYLTQRQYQTNMSSRDKRWTATGVTLASEMK
jgi:hypothetical protein